MDYKKSIDRINYYRAELESLYHKCSIKLGITDSVSMALYSIYVEGGECLIKKIRKDSGMPKQTLNSALRTLENDGIIILKNYNESRFKIAILTEKGKEFVDETIAKLFKAEENAFNSWTEDEIEQYISFMERYNKCFQNEIKKL